MHRMITMHTRPRQPDRQTDRQTDEHHGNSATIRSMNASCAKNNKEKNNLMELDGLLSTVMPLPAVTLTFDLLTPKPNQYVSCTYLT